MSKGSCSFCGERFDNVFEAVDHLDEDFDPKLIVSTEIKLGIGEMLYDFYAESKGNPMLQDKIEETFALLYIAEKRPEKFEGILRSPLLSPKYAVQYVYDIVGEDSWKMLKDEVKEAPGIVLPEALTLLVQAYNESLMSKKTFLEKITGLLG